MSTATDGPRAVARPHAVRRLPGWAHDCGIAALAGVGWFGAIGLLTDSGVWNPRSISTYWLAGAWLVVALAARRSAPAVLFWVTLVGYPVLQPELQSYFVLLPVLVVSYAATRAGAVAPVIATIGSAISAVALIVNGRPPMAPGGLGGGPAVHLSGGPSEALTLAALAGGAAVLGAVIRRLAVTTQSLRAANAELRALQEERARHAVAAERTRIARELHDVVAHHLTAIVVRAQAADRVSARRPEAPGEAVRWIAQEGGTALTAMRSVVRVLREDEASAPPSEPTPSLQAVVDTVERMRAAGHAVELTLPTRPRELPPAIELAVVRIVQEALTNVLLHSAAEASAVEIQHGRTHVEVTVRDPGPSRPRAPHRTGGNGIVGMRERAEALGGSCHAAPDGDGWLVRARLPWAAP